MNRIGTEDEENGKEDNHKEEKNKEENNDNKKQGVLRQSRFSAGNLFYTE